MSRALKIVSPAEHPEPRGSEGSASGRITKKISPFSLDTLGIRQARLDLSPSFGLSSRQKRARRDQARGGKKEEETALETINKLMVTISHYLSNPLTVLLGRVELLSEATENGGMSRKDIKKFTDSCKKEIHKIDSIIKVFQSLCEVRYKTYPPGIKMLDVEKDIKDRLKEVEANDVIGTKRR